MWGSYTFRSPSASNDATSKEPARLASGRPVEITVRNLDAELPAKPSLSSSNIVSTSPATSPPLSMGWLLRLFRSDFFDAFMAVTYLYRYRDSRGVHDYLCNELYKLSDADLEAFMPQVCNLLVHHARDSPGLERFVMDKCAESMHIALQVFWFLQAAVEDGVQATNRDDEARVRLLRTRCETAAVNGSHHAMLAAAADRISAAALVAVESPFSNSKRQIEGNSLFPSSSAGQLTVTGAFRHPALSELFVPSTIEAEEGQESKKIVRHLTTTPIDMATETENSTPKEAEDERGAISESQKENDVDRLAKSLQETKLVDPAVSETSVPVDVRSAPENSIAENEDAFSSFGEAAIVEVASTPFEAWITQAASTSSEESSIHHGSEPTSNHSEKGTPPEEIKEQEAMSKPSHGAVDPEKDFDPITLLTMKQERFDYFNDSLSIAQSFVRLSMTTRDLPPDQRQTHLSQGLEKINDILLRRMKGELGIPLLPDTPVPDASEVAKLGRTAALRSVHLPLTRANSHALRILRVNSEEAIILTSRTRAPYMVNIEVLPTEMLCSDKLLFCEQRVTESQESTKAMLSHGKPPKSSRPHAGKSTDDLQPSTSKARKEVENCDLPTVPDDGSSVPTSVRRLSEMTPGERQRANVRKIVYGDACSRQEEIFSLAEGVSAKTQASDAESADFKARQAVILGVYGELWSWKEERILSKSPFKDLKDTRLMPFIVKAGDDLRQEQLAIQLISQFQKIFMEEGVDVFLRPFTVMSVSSEAGFVEVITDAVSVHSLKKRTPNFVSLLDYFERAFGTNGTRSFRAAQRRFIRSMAGYSLATYFLQIKDRHNGNIMLDVKGRIIHIDFGFMLTNSPGAIKFENVPFKLTEEYLQVICAKKNVQDLAEASKTEGYRYFQELFVLGLLAARKHYEKITTLVEIMTQGTTMPCMTGGHSIVETLRNRFAVGMPEEQCINFALSLIEESRLSWRSAGYDRFQAYSNGYR